MLFINGIPLYLETDTEFYADDTTVHAACKSLKVVELIFNPEELWSCIAYLSAEDMLKSAVIGEKKFKHSPRVEAYNPLGPKF